MKFIIRLNVYIGNKYIIKSRRIKITRKTNFKIIFLKEKNECYLSETMKQGFLISHAHLRSGSNSRNYVITLLLRQTIRPHDFVQH